MSLQALFPTLTMPIVVEGGELSPEEDFEVLGRAIEAAGLTESVRDLEDFTLFAPTDVAFSELAQSLGYDGDPDDTDAVFGAIAGALTDLSEDNDPIPLLTDILLYHVAPDQESLNALNAGGPVETLLEGATFEVSGGTVVDGDPDYENAGVIAPDLAVPGGAIQIVDQVMLPIDAPVASGDPTLLDILGESGGSFDSDGTDFDMLLTALQATGLDETVDDPEADVTVFVPNDAAFIGLAQDLGYEGEDETEAFRTILDAAGELDPENPLGLVTQILAYHVSPGIQDSEAVLGSEMLETLEGGEIMVDGTTLVDLDTNAEDASIIQTDIEASNGIAHAIDSIMRPVDLPQLDEDGADPEDDGDNDSITFFLEALGVMGLVLAAFALV